MTIGLIGIVMLLGLVAAVVLLVVGVIWALKSKENRAIGIVLAIVGGVMLLGGAGFVVYGLLRA